MLPLLKNIPKIGFWKAYHLTDHISLSIHNATKSCADMHKHSNARLQKTSVIFAQEEQFEHFRTKQIIRNLRSRRTQKRTLKYLTYFILIQQKWFYSHIDYFPFEFSYSEVLAPAPHFIPLQLHPSKPLFCRFEISK